MKVAVIFTIAILVAFFGTVMAAPIKDESRTSPIVIKFSHVFAANTPQGQAADYFKKLAEERTSGDVLVEVYPDSSLFQTNNEIAALGEGRVQLLAPSLTSLAALGVKAFELFDLPFLFENFEDLQKVTQGPLGTKILRKLEPTGFYGLAFWDEGFKVISANKPLRTPDDFKGQNILSANTRVLKSQLRAMGANPMAQNQSDIYLALKSGTVDGAESTPSTISIRKLHEVQKHVILSDHGYKGYAIIVNRRYWNELPAIIRRILEDAMKDATELANDLAKKDNRKALAEINKSGRVQFVFLNPTERAVWKKTMDRAHRENINRIGYDLVREAYIAVGYNPK